MARRTAARRPRNRDHAGLRQELAMALARRAFLRRMEARRRRRCRPGLVLDFGHSKVTAHSVIHGDGARLSAGVPQAVELLRLRLPLRSRRPGGRHQQHAIAGEGIGRIALNADVLVHCCYMASAGIENEHFRRVVQHASAVGDTVGKIASRTNAKALVLTHHRPGSSPKRSPATSPDASSSVRI
jgi:hypothetical protein